MSYTPSRPNVASTKRPLLDVMLQHAVVAAASRPGPIHRPQPRGVLAKTLQGASTLVHRPGYGVVPAPSARRRRRSRATSIAPGTNDRTITMTMIQTMFFSASGMIAAMA